MNRNKKAIAYYITPHGFGHAVRSLEILRRIRRMEPDLNIIIVSEIPASLVEQNAGRKIAMRRARLDIGLHQYDSVRFDLEKTWAGLKGLQSEEGAILERETAFLKRENVAVVVSDIPFLPFEAAYRCGIPGIGVSNFTWDWIYRTYAEFEPRWEEVVAWARGLYGRCSLFLRLPMHGDCSACPRVEDVPLVTRKVRRTRNEVRRIWGIDPAEKVCLVSFTSLVLDRPAVERLGKIRGVTFLYKSPLVFPVSGARSFDESGVSYAEAVAAVDGVITKPGYGIVADCLASGTPILYTERGLFAEYPVLVEAMERHLGAVYMAPADFWAGNWEPQIRKLCSLPRKAPRMAMDGARVCAEKILELA